MTPRALVTATLLTSLALTACGPMAGDSLTSVLPDQRVLINLPTEGDAAKDENDREWSEAYLFTARVTDDVNGLIGGVLLLVDAVTDLPPTYVDETQQHAVWGPYSDALDPVETSLFVQYMPEDDTHHWGFVQKAKNVDDAEEIVVIQGLVNAGATQEVSSGAFTIDFDAMSALDPNTRGSGLFMSEYDIREDGVDATAAYEGVQDGAQTIDAAYVYSQLEDGSGHMDLAWLADALGGDDEELALVRSRWLGDGQGRSDSYLTGGDLGEAGATGVECWGDTFAPVYQANSWEGELSGEEAACAFDAPEFSDEGEHER